MPTSQTSRGKSRGKPPNRGSSSALAGGSSSQGGGTPLYPQSPASFHGSVFTDNETAGAGPESSPAAPGAALDADAGTPDVAVDPYAHFDPLRKYGLAWVDRMIRRDKSSYFTQPVPLDLVPDYLSIVETPMDLGTLRERLASGTYYTDAAKLRDDMELIWNNCCKYNASSSDYYKKAQRLKALMKQSFPQLVAKLQATGVSTSGGGASGLANASPAGVQASGAQQLGFFGARKRRAVEGSLSLSSAEVTAEFDELRSAQQKIRQAVARPQAAHPSMSVLLDMAKMNAAHAGTTEAGTASILRLREGFTHSFSPAAAQLCRDLLQGRGFASADTQCKAQQPSVLENVSTNNAAETNLVHRVLDENHRDMVKIIQLRAIRASSASDSRNEFSQVLPSRPSSTERYLEDQIQQRLFILCSAAPPGSLVVPLSGSQIRAATASHHDATERRDAASVNTSEPLLNDNQAPDRHTSEGFAK
ncbi:Bromodomain-containing protein 1 [Porphyridium purpureum]|uniref:Bromodomain-containing protein 1 n=1 Tax=Porphyridium purpureum TaxID=35688 RepID=A0A5J4YHT9_PORPP|nr:Bromodomain-containing protein 1 [Porphyridium purpureum]|eukprot:POR5520..scf289_17